MNPTEIFGKPSTQILTQKEPQTKVSICPCMCNMESKTHF